MLKIVPVSICSSWRRRDTPFVFGRNLDVFLRFVTFISGGIPSGQGTLGAGHNRRLVVLRQQFQRQVQRIGGRRVCRVAHANVLCAPTCGRELLKPLPSKPSDPPGSANRATKFKHIADRDPSTTNAAPPA